MLDNSMSFLWVSLTQDYHCFPHFQFSLIQSKVRSNQKQLMIQMQFPTSFIPKSLPALMKDWLAIKPQSMVGLGLGWYCPGTVRHITHVLLAFNNGSSCDMWLVTSVLGLVRVLELGSSYCCLTKHGHQAGSFVATAVATHWHKRRYFSSVLILQNRTRRSGILIVELDQGLIRSSPKYGLT